MTELKYRTLTLLSASLAAFKWFSIASKSNLGNAVSMLYTSKLSESTEYKIYSQDYELVGT